MKTINDLDFDIPKEIENYTIHSNEIAIMISNYIRSIKGMNKKSFAELVGKTASDVTRWVSGNHNFTILTISLIEARTSMSILKKLSSDNVKSYLDCEVFKLKTEEELNAEIIRLKNKIKSLEKESEISNLSQILLSELKTHGVYDKVSSPCINDLFFRGSELNSYKMISRETLRVRSKGTKLLLGPTRLVNK